MSKGDMQCDKCKARVPHLWKHHHVKKSDGAISELWICDNCGLKVIEGFAALLEKVNKIEKDLSDVTIDSL